MMSEGDHRSTATMSRGEDEMARMLRLAGARQDVPSDRFARAHEAVRDHWRAEVRRRRARRRVTAAAALLPAAAVLVMIVRFALPATDAVPAPVAAVASVARVEGDVRVFADGSAASARAVSTDRPVYEGEWVTTGVTGRVALGLSHGGSVRLDTGSRARLHSSTVVELVEGALYVDTGRDVSGLEIRTPLGTARDIGTQFEVRVRSASLRVRVRTGVVELWRDDRAITARPGTELTVTPGGVASGPIPRFGPEWTWMLAIAPPLEIDGRPLASFLDEVSHEQGWTLRYADSALARDAAGIVLHGSVRGLSPQDALGVALATSGLEYSLEDGELVVWRPGGSNAARGDRR